jgi:hypothetical protein
MMVLPPVAGFWEGFEVVLGRGRSSGDDLSFCWELSSCGLSEVEVLSEESAGMCLGSSPSLPRINWPRLSAELNETGAT